MRNFDQLILWCQNCARKIGRKQKSHGDHKAIEHDLENRLAVLPIWSNILKYRISKNSVISCFQVLNPYPNRNRIMVSWCASLRLYLQLERSRSIDENLTETTKVLAIRNMVEAVSLSYQSCWLYSQRFGTSDNLNRKGIFPDPFILG